MMNMLVTIGPSCEKIEDLKFLAAKTNLFRLNGSHNKLDWHAETIKRIRSLKPDAFILLDIPGIKPRTANTETLDIQRGEIVSFGISKVTGATKHIELTKNLPLSSDGVDTFSVNDGQYVFDVVSNEGHSISGRSRETFSLIQKKGLNIPESIYEEDLQKDIYLDFIKKVSHMDINAVGLSFVQTGKLVSEIRLAAPDLILISKIENLEGYKNKSSIIGESDAVMIDRGDLAAEIGIINLFNAVEEISLETKNYGKPLIMATENLETMTVRLEPSKSEVMSLGHSAVLGADCIMLSEETATSDNFRNTVKWLHNFVSKNVIKSSIKKESTQNRSFPDLWKSIKNLSSMPIILFTHSGRALSELVSTCNDRRVIVVTNNKKVSEVTKLHKLDIEVLHIEMQDTIPSEMVYDIVSRYKSKVFAGCDEVLAVYVSKQFTGARANNMTFLQRDMFPSK